MDVRDKLAELLWEYDQMRMMRMSIEECVDRLIPKGLTVTKCENDTKCSDFEFSGWISVKDRLPEENGYYLCEVCFSSVSDCKSYRRMILYWEDNVWIDMPNCFKTRKPTHWMPLPQPPKGE